MSPSVGECRDIDETKVKVSLGAGCLGITDYVKSLRDPSYRLDRAWRWKEQLSALNTETRTAVVVMV